MTKMRVRFAPSPTGHLHVGGARTALFNWLLAKNMGGSFILRIEDTDVARSTRESETLMLQDLKWLGLDWVEGPDVGGEFGPYRQSERLHIYKEYAEKLVQQDKAYYCFCSDEELTELREQNLAAGKTPHYSGKCRQLSAAQREELLAAGRKPAIRFRALLEDISFTDLVRDRVTFPQGMIGDFIILRNQGYPIYNFCVTVDDALMRITHVLRGEEHLPNTLRQIMLYEALGFPLPQFAHLSLILGQDRSKLSKRHGDTSLGQYQQRGYLPEALLNYLALLGWSPAELSEGVEEMFSAAEISRQFSLERVSKSPAIFDIDKLNFLNGQYIRQAAPEKITQLARPYLEAAGLVKADTDPGWLAAVILELRGQLNCLSEITQYTDVFFADHFSPKTDEDWAIIRSAGVREMLQGLRDKLRGLTSIAPENFSLLMKELQKEFGLKGKALYMPVRIALSGQQHGPDLGNIVALVGPANCYQRLEYTLNLLSAPAAN